jgi:BirA family transcriptional regulator, biotin operon repressor / biotin---[acetyl-CoA-carboxylase] ligase
MNSDLPAPHTRILELDVVDSTNAEAMRQASAGERGPIWITARRQTAGRGRSGRPWSAPQGNLAASYLFMPPCKPEQLHQLALLAGVAVHSAINRCAGQAIPGLRLKWPNDVMINRAKAGGILVETTTYSGVMVAIIGIGINVAQAPVADGRATVCLAGHVPGLTAPRVRAAIDAALPHWLGLWQGGVGFDAVRRAWLARAGAVGEAISVNAGHERIEGSFLGIDDGGALLLREAQGVIRRLTYGDVSLAGAAGDAPERTAQ